MARIIDKDTRIIDIDFGPLTMAVTRNAGQINPQTLTESGNGVKDLVNSIDINNNGTGSFIQYQRIDLGFMVANNEVMMPVDISVQRTSPVPLGFNNNGNNFDQIEEYVYVFTRPLNNESLGEGSGFMTNIGDMEDLRHMGLTRAEGTLASADNIAGKAGWPNFEQCVYAEKRMYSYNQSLGATISNGELDNPSAADPPTPIIYNSLMGMPVLDSVTTWGSMGAITGPNLHCYRIVLNRNQTIPNLPEIVNLGLAGSASCEWPPVSVQILCKDPNFTEAEYLTRLANAMNNVAIGAPTA